MRPSKILFVMLSIYAVLAAVMYVFPSEGIAITADYKLQFVSPDEFFSTERNQKKDISGILAQSEAFNEALQLDTDADADSIETIQQVQFAKRDTIKPILFPLQFPENNPGVFHAFWDRMLSLRKSGELVRIMHFGDSQIEGDRISSYLRNQMQKHFGGMGIGLRPAKQAFDFSASYRQENSGDWYRYTSYGLKDSTLAHSRFGAACHFARFAPFYNDSIPNDSIVYKASVHLSKSSVSYASARKAKLIRLYYSHNAKPVSLKAYSGEQLVSTDSLKPGTAFKVRTWKLPDYIEDFRLDFTGKDSPDIYGITLDDTHGVAVDNIAMRGASGLMFRRMNRTMMREMFKELNPAMLILQFGGNITPYVKEDYAFYERGFYSQLKLLREMLPDVAIVVIGPADMSRKEKDQLVSYPNIPLIRDAMRAATFRAGGAFWDMYEAMGGKNSMPSWVEHNPPLAERDYVHFNVKGARVVAEMFYKALIDEYEKYKAEKENL